MRKIAAVAVIIVLLAIPAIARIINVPGDYLTIQNAIDRSVDGDTVLVQQGTYVENINFGGRAITVGSLFLTTGNASYIFQTVIDGNAGGAQGSVVTFNNGEGQTSVLKGFTLTNGSGNYQYWRSGGGIYCENAGPSLEYLRITGNSADFGSGIYANVATPVLEHVAIINNSRPSGELYSQGGGIYCWDANINLIDVTISENYADIGGGINCRYSYLNFNPFDRCNVYSNSALVGNDFFADQETNYIVVLDTMTVPFPTDYNAYPLSNFTFDVLHEIHGQVRYDVYVSPSGSNSNSGQTPEEAVQTISFALSVIRAEETNHLNIHLADGVYSPSSNGESFPLSLLDWVALNGQSQTGVLIDAENQNNALFMYGRKEIRVANLSIAGGEAYYGGGICCYNTDPTLKNVTISDNTAYEGGGGIFFGSSDPVIENVTIVENTAYIFGGGIYLSGSNPAMLFVTFSGNEVTTASTPLGGGMFLHGNSNPTMVNGIFWDNQPQQISFSGGGEPNSFVTAYSDIDGGESGIELNGNGTLYWEEGNIEDNPLFIDPVAGNYELQSGSPCRDTGTAYFVWNSDTLVDLEWYQYWGDNPDMGAFEYGAPAVEEPEILPDEIALLGAYPNPFNPSTILSYHLQTISKVELNIYDVHGRLLTTLIDGSRLPGQHQLTWDASDYASGIYIAQLNTSESAQTQKLVLVK